MHKSVKLLLAGALLLAQAGMAHADTAAYHDAVRGTNGLPVHSTNGECVRTQWLSGTDACAKKVAEPVAPAPAPKKAPIALEDRTIYFGFGKASLTKEAKGRLATLAHEMKTRKVKAVHIAGYADRIGKAAANEKLSKKRAEAVRSFLVTQGITADLAETRWFGDSVAAAKCPKNLKKKDLVLCLQPDRRVEVEIEYMAD